MPPKNNLLNFYAVEQVTVNQDTTTVLANDDLLALTDLALTLRGNSVEATTAGIALYRYYRKTVAVVLTNTIVRIEQALFYFFTGFGRQLIEMLFLLFRYRR